jgi:predicted chitinase
MTKLLCQRSRFEIWREEGQIAADNKDWAKRLLWNMKQEKNYCERCRLGEQITVEDAGWVHRLLWKMQTGRTDYCGRCRL